jgi:uncharacterized membrane protein YhaH (DUF805 family)
MTIWQSGKNGFSQALRHSGRTRLADFGTFLLFLLTFSLLLLAIDIYLTFVGYTSSFSFANWFLVIASVPTIAMVIRRLHDNNRGARHLLRPLLGLIPLGFGLIADSPIAAYFGMAFVALGPLVVLAWSLEIGAKGANTFGEDPIVWHPIDDNSIADFTPTWEPPRANRI